MTATDLISFHVFLQLSFTVWDQPIRSPRFNSGLHVAGSKAVGCLLIGAVMSACRLHAFL